MYLGIDLGTSSVKAILLAENGSVIASKSAPLTISRPNPLWSEQNPNDWWHGTELVIKLLAAENDLKQVKALGLTGQMHGATLLDKQHQVLRPAILWNDGRSFSQCHSLGKKVPSHRDITGNLIMPGFTAPKLLWVAENEPEIFKQIDKVLLPKDYIRFLISGDFASDMSDSAGTLWFDVAKRDWNDEMLEACSLSRQHMPILYEGSQVTGYVSHEVAKRWGMNSVPIVAGGGDNAAGAIGVGLYQTGQAMLSLGTSGVYFAVSDGFLCNPMNAVHSFCHALPGKWHLMSVMLSASVCLDWACKITGIIDVPTLINRVENASSAKDLVWFLPYLSGERTPHNNPNAKGLFWGLTHEHNAVDLARAVLEGVGFALADGMDALHESGLQPTSIILIGGGARSVYWRQMLADISGYTLEYRKGGDVGPALGAARLAQIGVNPNTPLADMLPELTLEQVHVPNKQRHLDYAEQRLTFKRLYQQLLPLCLNK